MRFLQRFGAQGHFSASARMLSRRGTSSGFAMWPFMPAFSAFWRSSSKAFAVQAGREVRIMVKPDVISDDQVILLARQIAKKIEDTLDYPGQIKVNVIRESRAIEYAK